MSALRRPHLLVFVAAAVPALVAYVLTLNPTVPAGDSGELITAAATFGVAHPPGYPLYVQLGWIWIHLLPWGEVAMRLNLMSAVAGASAAGMAALAVFRLAGSIAAALMAGWSLAFSAPLWKYAVVAEVFAPNALLAATALWAFASLFTPASSAHDGRDAPRAPDPRIVLSFLAMLLLSLNHTVLLLLEPIFIVVGLQRIGAVRRLLGAPPHPHRRRGRAIALACLAGLVPLAVMAWAKRSPNALVWGEPASWRGFLRLITRADFDSLRLGPASAGMQADRNHGVLFLESLPHDVGVIVLVFAAIGCVIAWRRHRALAFVVALFAVIQAVFFTRVGFPSHMPVPRGAIERFYILPELVICVLAGLGAAWVGEATRRRWVALVLAVVAPAWLLVAHARVANQSGNRFTSHVGQAILAALPPRAVLFAQGDLQNNALVYRTRVLHERPDVTVVDQELLTYDWYVRCLRRESPELLPPLGAAHFGLPGTRNLIWLEHLRGRRPVSFIGLEDDSGSLRWEMVPTGLVMQAYPLGQAPPVEAQARRDLELLAVTELDDYFHDYAPTSFEATERASLADVATRAALLLCQPAAAGIGAGADTSSAARGRARLLAFARRFDRLDPTPDPGCLRAIGMLWILVADVRDVARGRSDLERYLATGVQGAEADEARRVLAGVDNAR